MPTIPMTTSPLGFLMRWTRSSQADMSRPRLSRPRTLRTMRVQALAGEHQRHLVDGVHVLGGDDRLLRHVAVEGELGLDVGGEVAVGAAEQDVGLDADGAQLAHAVLHGLGLQLVRGGDVGHERQVHEDGVVAAHVLAELAHRLQEGQALDVAHRAADLHDHDVALPRAPTARMAALISSVMCGITCTVRPR